VRNAQTPPRQETSLSGRAARHIGAKRSGSNVDVSTSNKGKLTSPTIDWAVAPAASTARMADFITLKQAVQEAD
jgi:hypothetical protein